MTMKYTPGVPNMTTQAPMIGDSSGSFAIETKGRRGESVRGTINLPINGVSALRASAIVDRNQGDYHNVFTDKDSKTDKGGAQIPCNPEAHPSHTKPCPLHAFELEFEKLGRG